MSWFDDFSFDSFFSMDTVDSVISSLDSGLDGLTQSVASLFGDAQVGADSFAPLDSTFDFFGDSADKTFSFLFGDSGSMGMESEDGISAGATPPSKGIFEKTVDFVNKNPQTAKLGAGLIGGAMQGYEKQKDRDATAELFRQKTEAESKLLRERYGYDVQANEQKQVNAFGSFMNPPTQPGKVAPYSR